MASDSDRIAKLEERLQRLEHIEEIKKLKARYVRGCDFKKPDDVLDCFLPDATIDFPMAKWTTAAEFVEYYRKWGTPLSKIDIHHAMNGTIEITSPASATGVWALYYFGMNMETGKAGQSAVTYWDEYVLKDGRWWIKSCTSRTHSSIAWDLEVGKPMLVTRVDGMAREVVHDASKAPL